MTKLKTPNKPSEDKRFQKGFKQGALTVTKQLDYEDRGLSRAIWWYEVECTCGRKEEINQGHITAGRTACAECRRQRKNNREAERRTLMPKPDIDFASLPAPTLVPGPDSF